MGNEKTWTLKCGILGISPKGIDLFRLFFHPSLLYPASFLYS
jgi:hypothetical protein